MHSAGFGRRLAAEIEGNWRVRRSRGAVRCSGRRRLVADRARMGIRGTRFFKGAALVLAFVCAGATAEAARPQASTAIEVAVGGDDTATSFDLLLSKGVPAEIYTLASPFRVIIDLPDVAFDLSPQTGRKAQGLIKAFRYGLFAEGKARVVIDTEGPVVVTDAGMSREAKGVRLKLALKPTDAASFGGGTGATRQGAAPATQDASLAGSGSEKTGGDGAAAKASKAARARPVIIVDAGHGGIDPGTISPDGVTEKSVVLAVAKRVEAVLKKSGRYDVRMTRSKDVFVSLDQRLKFSSDNDADLFISLHADAIEARSYAESVRGATIYTLSEEASDEQARLMAEKENASDLIAGLETASIGGSDQVKNILIDLLKRETSNFSADFSNVLLGSLKPSIALSKEPQRSAAFKVLKQPNAPSVLVELGYMSNSKDQAQLTSAAWQTQAAEAIGRAVSSYFRKRKVLAP